MPGMDGHELSDRLTSRNVALKVLYMSGYADDVVANRRGAQNQGTTLLQNRSAAPPFSAKSPKSWTAESSVLTV